MVGFREKSLKKSREEFQQKFQKESWEESRKESLKKTRKQSPMESYEKSMNESEGNIPEKSRNFHRKEFVRGTPSGIPRRILSYVPSLATFLVELIEGFPMKLLED